jgi:hypothetical protein
MPARALAYRFFAKTYGFSERVVDEELSDTMYLWYFKIEQAEHRATELMRKQAEREARRGRHARF